MFRPLSVLVIKVTRFGKLLIQMSLLFLGLSATAATPRTLDGFLRDGRIQEGLVAFGSPKNNADRFSLAVLQVLDGLQQFSAGSSKLGINPQFIRSGLPFFRVMAMPPSTLLASNQVVTPDKVAALFNNLRDSMKKANATLAGINETAFIVELNLTLARMDIDGDGIVAPDEMILTKLGGVLGLPAQPAAGQDIIVRFDSADAVWLKGYTHLLIGMLDILMAYDWHPVWNQCAHVVFLNPDPVPPIAPFTSNSQSEMFSQWADLIAGVHDMRLELVDPEGFPNAQKEFKAMIVCSRICWQRVLAETDNDHEWLPSPRQTGPAGTKITQAQVDGWMKVLDELDAILAGQKLLPHWRAKNGTGINVTKLVASPPRLDLILFVQGSAFVPYFEEGTVSDRSAWRTLMEPFGPGFARFAIWSN